MTNTVPLDDNASQLPEARTTALETHPSWQRHNERRDNVYTDPGLDVMSEGFDVLERTGGFPDPSQTEHSPEAPDYDGAGPLEAGIGQCHHSHYWDGVERSAEDRWDIPRTETLYSEDGSQRTVTVPSTGYVNPA